MIAKNHATHGQPLRNRKFKGVAFDFAGDWTKNGQPRFFIVSGLLRQLETTKSKELKF